MNHLKNYLDTIYPLVQFRNSSLYLGEFQSRGLFELRTLSVGLPRQMGTTTMIADIFDAETDLYVGANKRMIEEFASKYGSNKFLYSTIRSISFDPLRGREQVKNIKRVFVDVSICSLFDTSTTRLTHQLMKKLDEFIKFSGNKNDPIYIIT